MTEQTRTRNKNRIWSNNEIQYLLTNYDKMSYRSIGKHLNMSENIVKNQAYKLNLKKTHKIIKDFSGFRKGNIVCISRDEHNISLFHCICEKCNTKIVLGRDFFRTSTKKQYTTNYCNCKSVPREKNNWKGCGEIPGWLYGKIRRNAKGRGIDFNVSVEYLHEILVNQNYKCPYSGIDITFTRIEEDFKYKTASLDRIDSSKGYIKGNVQWVTKQVNFMKQNLSHDEFLNLITKIYQNTRGVNHGK